jgi:hypothetical protein
MKLQQFADELNYKPIVVSDGNIEISDGYTSDLLSDVMGNAPEDSVLITIQAHKNTVAVASLVGIRAIVLCNGRSAPEDMQNAAFKEGVAIFSTTDNQFSVSCAVGELL